VVGVAPKEIPAGACWGPVVAAGVPKEKPPLQKKEKKEEEKKKKGLKIYRALKAE